MGIINHDSFLTRYGYSFTDGYLNLDPNSVNIIKNQESGLYSCSSVVRIYVSELAHSDTLLPIAYDTVFCTFTDPGVVNIYELLYSALKTKYPNHTDSP